MATPPVPSPWPAPTLGAAATHAAGQPGGAPPIEAHPSRPVTALVTTAKWLSSRSERAQRAATKVEQRITDELDDLPGGWFALHSIEIGAIEEHPCHLDHVVIGPGGVFTVHVDHQQAAKVWVSEHTVTINGRHSDLLRQARFGARRSGGLLSGACGFDVTVQSMLVLVGAANVQTLSRPAEVHVRDQHDIRDWLCKQPVRLAAEVAAAIHERALLSNTWQPSAELASLLD